MKGMPGLVCVELDVDTARVLRELCVFNVVHCHYITMAYRPSPEVYAKYADLIGKTVEFEMGAICQDDLAQAVTIKGVPCENTVPHITMSCTDGVKPSYSNTMLLPGYQKRISQVLVMPGRGTVQFIRF